MLPKNRILTSSAAAVIIVVLLGSGFVLGYGAGRKHPEQITVQGVSNPNNPSGNVDFSTFWEAWQLVQDNYLKNDSVSTQDKMYGAIGGMVRSLGDPYTEFFNPKDSKKFQEDIEGNFSGIGAEIGIRKQILTVISPLKDSPAMKAGLKSGDQILGINSTSTQDLSLDQSVQLIRGPEGTKVTLSILRSGWDKPKDFVITRANIAAPTLDFSMKGDVAYIQLYGFNANASGLFANAVARAQNANAKYMVLDLRNDPGGYLEVAVDIAGWFLPRGTLVVKEESRQGTTDEFRAQGNGSLVNMPVVVLVNGGSASASEILAGALRDDRKVKLVGETSFGKGTVQQLKDLEDGSSIKITIAHWVLPKGQILEGTGLKPDVEVKLTDTDVQAGKDPQLDKALQVVKGL
jgi:carboxyl-terminal processing protease